MTTIFAPQRVCVCVCVCVLSQSSPGGKAFMSAWSGLRKTLFHDNDQVCVKSHADKGIDADLWPGRQTRSPPHKASHAGHSQAMANPLMQTCGQAGRQARRQTGGPAIQSRCGTTSPSASQCSCGKPDSRWAGMERGGRTGLSSLCVCVCVCVVHRSGCTSSCAADRQHNTGTNGTLSLRCAILDTHTHTHTHRAHTHTHIHIHIKHTHTTHGAHINTDVGIQQASDKPSYTCAPG